jgi:hypothetical protein
MHFYLLIYYTKNEGSAIITTLPTAMNPTIPKMCFGAFGKCCKAIATQSIQKHKRERWLCHDCYSLCRAAALDQAEVEWLNGTTDYYYSSNSDESDTEREASDDETAPMYCSNVSCAELAPCVQHLLNR